MPMWPDARLCALLGIEHPIIQAPMLGSCTPALASAVANAGGLGSLACAFKPEGEILDQVAAMRAGSNRAFNLNFFILPPDESDPALWEAARARLRPWYSAFGLGDPPATMPAPARGFDAASLDLVLELKPRVVSFHFGCPGPEAVAALKTSGIVLISSATSVAEARALEAAGMDAIIAQGFEAGGHRGSHAPTAPADGVGTLALVPQVVDAVTVPVIAAGGIGDGRGIAAALALGASGVQIGTAFLGCPEAATDSARRARLRHASDQDTMVTDAVSGRAARAVRSRYAEEMERLRRALPPFPQMMALSAPLRAAGDEDAVSFHLYGQAAALSRAAPATEVIDRLVGEAQRVMARLGTR